MMIKGLSRRQVLAGSGALTLATACGQASPKKDLQKISKIGLQTYTLREALGQDFVGTFEAIKAAGYDYVELNRRNFTDRSPAELRRILDGVGLPSPVSHTSYDAVVEGADGLADVAATLGCKYLVIPWLDEDQRGADDYKRHAEVMNRAGETLKKSGVHLAYHNHQFEFFDLGDGVTGMDILLSQTEKDLVSIELDLFWSNLADVDIAALFKAHPGRFKLCHIKDMKGDPAPWRTHEDYGEIVKNLMVNVGEGTLPFERYFAMNDISGMEYFIAEHDNPPSPYKTSIQTSYDTVRNMRF